MRESRGIHEHGVWMHISQHSNEQLTLRWATSNDFGFGVQGISRDLLSTSYRFEMAWLGEAVVYRFAFFALHGMV